jgi:hypothetical protein
VGVIATIVKGLAGGALGTVVMTLGEKLEQRLTGRPDSYVPAKTAGRLFRLRRPDEESRARNWAMHWGTGMVVGAVRALMARNGWRGPGASLTHFALRVTTDETLENAVGSSKPPWKVPSDIMVIDLLHKAVYALATGAVVDRLVPDPRDHTRPRAALREPTAS